MFDIFRNLGYVWASYGIQVSGGLVCAVIGIIEASKAFWPEGALLREAMEISLGRRVDGRRPDGAGLRHL